ncbi:dolichyl-phosphate mannosyltransferase polypeptide 3 [Blastomyces dermatitidis ATCC 18188]|uniref:Dolichol-phosphate mannosyltransferase subunit 3 n=1 Tax=Ajellomyces dermatitidis (strain ATCC 18188 / CBS 674.68) TaxID=653446 RepID=F2TNV7_AJEDA|nr:dolichyl-phosphate mannosyltransferase polypeptide 3 [Blastomyces dermatitidis ATCC 18188]
MSLIWRTQASRDINCPHIILIFFSIAAITIARSNPTHTKTIPPTYLFLHTIHPANMTRAQQTLSVILLITSLYLALYLGLVPLNPTIQNDIIPVLPFYSLMVIGAYMLFRLGWGVYAFNDVPEAHESLQKEILEAKNQLRMAKVDVD